MQTESFDVELQVILRKRIKGIELRRPTTLGNESDYTLAANDLKKKLLRGTLELDSFDEIDARARFFCPDGKTERFGFLVDKNSKPSTIRELTRRVYWVLNKTLRRKG